QTPSSSQVEIQLALCGNLENPASNSAMMASSDGNKYLPCGPETLDSVTCTIDTKFIKQHAASVAQAAKVFRDVSSVSETCLAKTERIQPATAVALKTSNAI